MNHDHAHSHHAHLHDGPEHAAALGDLLDLDGEVLQSYLSAVTTWVAGLIGDAPRRILDLGAGTGTGTLAWARLFPDAEVIALDRSEEMLARTLRKAQQLGLADRVHPLQADLDQAWPALQPVDLAWASSSLHELADPDRVLSDLWATIRPGGMLVIAEMDAPPRFLPDDLGLGRPGLETRCHQVVEQDGSGSDHPDWGPALRRSGFAPVRRTFAVDLPSPSPPATGRYARTYLQRIRPLLRHRLGTDDLATLDTLLAEAGPDSLLQRDDLHVRGDRTVWAARRS